MASTESIKRVISNPDNQMRESKITKVDEDAPALDAPSLENEEMLNKLNISDAPVTTVSSRVESEADSSLSDENQNAPEESVVAAAAASTAAKIMHMQRTISAESNRSDSTGEAGRASIGNWGWFEDVHGHESVFLPGMKLDEGDEQKGDKSEKKKGGLLQMGSELMSSGPLLSNIEPQRGEYMNCSELFYW